MSNSSRTIWFLSHRQHYDPRIYHIMSVYRDRGWHTVLFDPPKDQMSSLEWAELVEAPWQPVTQPEIFSADRHGASKEVKAFLANLPVAAGAGLQRYGNVCFQRIRNGDNTTFAFQVDGERQRYVYEPTSDVLWGSPVEHSHAELTACAIARAGRNSTTAQELAAQLPGFEFTETDRDYLLEWPADYEYGEEYAIDKANGLVRRRILPRRYHYQVDQFLGGSFDYRDFKSKVYEYISELDLVNFYLALREHSTPDVVFISDLPVLPVGIMLKDRLGCKLIIDCHEWWSEQERIWNPNATRKIAAIDRWEKNLYARCDAALTVSETLAHAMSAHFRKPFCFVPTCVFDFPNLPARNPRFWQEQVGLPDGSSVVLFQGGLSSNRNLETLMRATRYLADDQYLVICGDGGFRAEMEKVLKSEGRADQVRMLGWQPQLELWRYTMHADLGIIPYTHTLRYYQLSAPNKLSEYHVCELPMLVDHSMVELSRVVSEDGIGRAANLSDPSVMGRSISEMLADKSATLGYRAAYRVAAKRFTRTQCEAYMTSILE